MIITGRRAERGQTLAEVTVLCEKADRTKISVTVTPIRAAERG
jgi:hypothetical protein